MDLVLTAWADDCVVRGTSTLHAADRLADRLNADERLELRSVAVEAFEEERTLALETLALTLDELCLVELAGERGDPERRRLTNRRRVSAEVGPFVVTGALHVLPGANPLATFRHRPRIVPLTEAVIELAGSTRRLRWEVPALGVNQTRIRSIREVSEPGVDEGWGEDEGALPA